MATPPDIRGVLWFLPIQEYLLERVEEFPRVHRLLERRTRSVVPGDAELRRGDSGDRDDGGGRVLLAQRLDKAWNEELRGRVRADEPRKDGASGDLGFREDQVSEDISRPQRPNSSPNSWDSEVRRSALTICCTCLSDSSNSPTGSPWWMCSPIPLVDLGGRGCRHGPGSRNTTDPRVVKNSHQAGNSNRRREGAHSRSGRRRRLRSCDRASWWSSGFYPIGKSRPARRVRARVFSVSAPPVSSMLKSP